MLHDSVMYAKIMYESLMLWTFFIVGIHALSGSPLTIFSLGLMFSAGVIMATVLIYIFALKNKEMVVGDTSRFQTAQEYQIYLFRLYQVIESDDPGDYILL